MRYLTFKCDAGAYYKYMNAITSDTARSWGRAYLRFLRSRDENLFLKIAPLILIFGSPEVLISNLLPVVGEALDVGTLGIIALVVYRTARAVRKYR